MADEPDRYPGDSPGSFINGVAAGVREALEQDYADRLLSARAQMREAQDRADAERICMDKATMTQHMAEYRRGRWYHLGGIVASAASGFGFGLAAQQKADLRIGPVPAMAIAGLPGVAAGLMLDEGVALRASLAVGGAMFIVGAVTHVCLNPRPDEETV